MYKSCKKQSLCFDEINDLQQHAFNAYVYIVFPHVETPIENQNELNNFFSENDEFLSKNQHRGAILKKKTLHIKAVPKSKNAPTEDTTLNSASKN